MGYKGQDALLDNLLVFSKVYGGFAAHITNLVDQENPKVYIGILHVLKKYGPMPISRIGQKIDIAKPNMTMLIDGLVQKGWVERSTSEHDRRIINIELTEEGERYIDYTTEKLFGILRDKLTVLSEEEREKMIECLNYLIDISKRLTEKK
ncbi:MAG: MarR family transcriptional regulator [Clostridia bacterium]|nr:MarR family transcriptional regulator [Clostridia bacterium]